MNAQLKRDDHATLREELEKAVRGGGRSTEVLPQ